MAELPLRILVIGNLPPYVLGGAENQIARLTTAWLSAGAHVEVAGHRIPDGWQMLGDHSVRTHHLTAWARGGRAGRALGYLISMATLVRQNRHAVDVIYCRGMGDGLLSLVLMKAIRWCRLPIVACPINAKGHGDAAFLRSVPGWRLWCRLIDRHVQAINLINVDIEADLASLFIARPRVSRIPNGIPLQPKPDRKSVLTVRRLVWTGRLDPQKGIDVLIEALTVCRREGRQFKLDLYGDGDLLSELLQLVKDRGLADCVAFHPAVAVTEVRDRLLQADVFVLPSRYEGMSNSALEAMEAGLPVLCTRCGGIDVYLEDGIGWIAEPDSWESLVGALRAMFDAGDEELLTRGRSARSLIEDQFAMDRIAAANLELLRTSAKVEGL
jgi:glycosyltransferase involved in cell wall biosynthesis